MFAVKRAIHNEEWDVVIIELEDYCLGPAKRKSGKREVTCDDPELLYYFAIAYLKTDQIEEAELVAQAGLEHCAPEHADLEEGLRQLVDALASMPRGPEAKLTNAVRIAMQEENWNAVIALLEPYCLGKPVGKSGEIEVTSDNPELLYYLAIAYVNTQQLAEAAVAARAGLKLSTSIKLSLWRGFSN